MHSDWVKIFTRLALSDHCGFFWSREITLPWKLFMTFSLSQAFNLKPRKSKTMQVDSGKVGLNLASGPVTSFWSEKPRGLEFGIQIKNVLAWSWTRILTAFFLIQTEDISWVNLINLLHWFISKISIYNFSINFF